MRKLGKIELDQIGANVVMASVLDARATDMIADSPELFAAVLRRVETLPAEQAVPQTSILNRRLLAGAATFTILLVASIVITLGVLNKENEVVATAQPIITAPSASVTTVEIAQPTTSRVSDRVDELPITGYPPVPLRASVRESSPRPRQRKPIRNETSSTTAEFYPLTYAGDPSETARGGRVIRVDMSRSSLFAMGVDLPLENESDSVKADLLVGPDGVARGIRIVK